MSASVCIAIFAQTERLRGLGAWIRKHEEAVYPTIAGLPFGHFYGPTTLSKDKKTLYLYLSDIPRGEIMVKGLYNEVKNARVVGTNFELKHHVMGGAAWVNIPGITYIEVPENVLDEIMTVIALDFEEELKIYHGPGQSIEKN